MLEDDLFLVQVPDPDQGPARKTLSHSRSPLVLLGMASNKYVRTSARIFTERYGLGIMDWRMLVTLTRHPGATVTLSSRLMGIDKAAVSRSLTRLEEKGWVVPTQLGRGERRKSWKLSEQGKLLHEEVLSLSMQLHRSVLDGFTPQEIGVLNGLLKRFLVNLETLNDLGLRTDQEEGEVP